MSGSPRRRTSKNQTGTLSLSSRERDILRLATLGYTDRAISDHLGISKATIGTYWNRLRLKIGPLKRTELVAAVLRSDFDQELRKARSSSGRLEPSPLSGPQTSTHANVLIVDASAIVTGASPIAASLFGASLSGLLGSSVGTWIPDLPALIQSELLRAQIRGVAEACDSHSVELVGRSLGGRSLPLTVILWPVATSAGWVVLCGLRNLDFPVEDACPQERS